LKHLFYHIILLNLLMCMLLYVLHKMNNFLVIDRERNLLVKIPQLVRNKLKHLNIYWFRQHLVHA
jgi:hypothetical protein